MEQQMTTDSWDPGQYNKFAKERNEPFEDLIKLIVRKKGFSFVDLGCGTGELTARLQQTLQAKGSLGIDASEAMLMNSSSFANAELSFQCMTIQDFVPKHSVDLIFSNAAFSAISGAHKKSFWKNEPIFPPVQENPYMGAKTVIFGVSNE